MLKGENKGADIALLTFVCKFRDKDIVLSVFIKIYVHVDTIFYVMVSSNRILFLYPRKACSEEWQINANNARAHVKMKSNDTSDYWINERVGSNRISTHVSNE